MKAKRVLTVLVGDKKSIWREKIEFDDDAFTRLSSYRKFLENRGLRFISVDRYPRIQREHDWSKNCLVTQEKKGMLFDLYKCKNCGATGKRFGLGEFIAPDRKSFRTCK